MGLWSLQSDTHPRRGLFPEPEPELFDREGEVGGKVGGGEALLRSIERLGTVVGLVDKDGFFSGIDEPAEAGAMVEAVEDIFGDWGGTLVGGEDFDRPVGGQVEAVGHLSLGVAGDISPFHDGNIGDDGMPPKGKPQFGEGAGNFGSFEGSIEENHQFGLEDAVFPWGHGFLADFAVAVFLGRFGFGELEKLREGEGRGEGLGHG